MGCRKACRTVCDSLRSILVGSLVLTGCTAVSLSSPADPRYTPSPFPPQGVMQRGDYAQFLHQNRQELAGCTEVTRCAVALFNLGFVYGYPPSPYHDLKQAMEYFNQLHQKYPHTPWAFHGQAWLALLHEQRILEDTQHRLEADVWAKEVLIEETQRRLQEDLRAKDAMLAEIRRRLQVDVRTREALAEETRHRLQVDLEAKEATIRTLREQLGRSQEQLSRSREQLSRSRAIDMEMEQKERQLIR